MKNVLTEQQRELIAQATSIEIDDSLKLEIVVEATVDDSKALVHTLVVRPVAAIEL